MTSKISIIKVFIHLFWFLFFSVIIIGGSVILSALGPKRYYFKDNSFDFSYNVPEISSEEYNVVFDAHSHTGFNGAEGSLTPKQNILWHIAHGYNAMALTDHHSIEGAIETQRVAREEFAGQFIVLVGTEWTTNRIHMNLIGINELILRPSPNPTDLQIQLAINATHDQGGIVVANHLPWTAGRNDYTPTRQQLLDWGVDFIEMVNENQYDKDSLSWCNKTGGFGQITGTDMHVPHDVHGWTAMNVSEFTETSIFNELKSYNTTIFYDPVGSEDKSVFYENIDYKIAEPLIIIGDMFQVYYPGYVDWEGISIFTIYMLGIFTIAEFIRFGNRKFWKKRNDKLDINKKEKD